MWCQLFGEGRFLFQHHGAAEQKTKQFHGEKLPKVQCRWPSLSCTETMKASIKQTINQGLLHSTTVGFHERSGMNPFKPQGAYALLQLFLKWKSAWAKMLWLDDGTWTLWVSLLDMMFKWRRKGKQWLVWHSQTHAGHRIMTHSVGYCSRSHSRYSTTTPCVRPKATGSELSWAEVTGSASEPRETVVSTTRTDTIMMHSWSFPSCRVFRYYLKN